MTSTVAILTVAILSPWLCAAEAWTLTTADLKRQSVAVQAIDAQGLRLLDSAGQPLALPMDQFLQVDRPIAGGELAGTFTLYLASGDRLGGQPIALEGEQLRWSSPAVGELTVSLRQVAGLVRGTSPPGDLEKPRTQDLAKLANGDSVQGIVSAISKEQLTLSVGGDSVVVPIESVSSLLFATVGQSKSPAQRGFRVRLADGSSFLATSLQLADNRLSLALPDQSTRQLDLAKIAGLEQVNGPVAWLSSLTPLEDKQVSQFDLTWPTRVDRTVTNQPIRYDRVYDHGLGVHARSVLVFALDGQYQSFRTQYGIDGNGELADVTVRIKLDDKTVHERPYVKAGKLWPVVEVPLNNAKTLTLEVDFGDNGDTQDRFNWVEPALLRKPQ